ncbi:MAG: hypothetical protein AVDCRST_MAG71-2664, partial [uncultured Lysobacter sp.]
GRRTGTCFASASVIRSDIVGHGPHPASCAIDCEHVSNRGVMGTRTHRMRL